MIPDAAVEAAARAYHGQPVGRMSWDDLAPMVRQIRLKKMRAALESGAPHMLAEAWDAGCWQGYREGADDNLTLPPADNPYRTAK